MRFVAKPCLLLCLGLVAPLSAQIEPLSPSTRTQAWDSEVVDLFRRVPVLEGGRIKPLDTSVSFFLLRLHGSRKMRLGGDKAEVLSPMEWGLDCLFHPRQAADYKLFQVQTSAVIDAMQLPHAGKRERDYYSYKELNPGKERLFGLAENYRKIPQQQRSVVQDQVVNLARNLGDYDSFCEALSFARLDFLVGDSRTLKQLFPQRQKLRFSEVAEHGPKLYAEYQRLDKLSDPDSMREKQALAGVLRHVQQLGRNGVVPNWLPPAAKAAKAEVGQPDEPLDPALATLNEFVSDSVFGQAKEFSMVQLAAVAGMERAVRLRSKPAEFKQAVIALHQQLSTQAKQLGVYEKVVGEVAFYRVDYFYKSLLGFIFTFVFLAVSWTRLGSHWLRWLTWLGALVSIGYLVAGITVRSFLMDRSPVATLYETVLFVTAVGVLVGMAIEAINRRRVALALAVSFGALGLFVATAYEITEGRDTMAPLIAVLRTNFWLSTHVTCITIGYAACLLSGFIAHVYLLAVFLRLKKTDRTFFHDTARVVYGVLCFGLLFSLVGTILGGIWANESWGRFWGWDPKENGALMIVLWCVFVVHAKQCGWLRDFGVCAAAVAGNVVVAFSWWGVNQLNVGLHSYGFAAGINTALNVFYIFEAVVLCLGLIALNNQRIRAATLDEVSEQPPQTERTA